MVKISLGIEKKKKKKKENKFRNKKLTKKMK